MTQHSPIALPDPVPTRARADGWTLDRQRAFLEALADSGSVRAACARVGMSAQAAYSLRRRSDARAFRQAWDAARAFAAHALEEAAWDRAINGTIKQHFYHGELVAETRVYSDKLLIQLLDRNRDALEASGTDPHVLEEVMADWDGALDRLGSDDWIRSDAEWAAENVGHDDGDVDEDDADGDGAPEPDPVRAADPMPAFTSPPRPNRNPRHPASTKSRA